MFPEDVMAMMRLRVRPVLRRLLVGLGCALVLMNQAGAAQVPISKQLAEIRPGTAVQVQTTDGRTLEGKLISASDATFELLQHGRQDTATIECTDVISVSAMSEPPRKRGSRFVTALMVAGYFAATGIAIAVAGKVY